MPTNIKVWDRLEWQRWVVALLYRHYGPGNFQRVPDKHGGDYGVEGFSRDGCVYQCYAPDEPIDTATLHEKHRDKIRVDIAKFANNRAHLTKLFAPTTMTRWLLVVPRQESASLLKYCADKSAEVVRLALPYVARDFSIGVCTDEAWPKECSELRREGLGELNIDHSLAPAPDVDAWVAANSDRVLHLERKAHRLTSPENHGKFVQASIRAHIQGQNDYERLRNDMPDICDDVVRIKNVLEEQLELDCAVAPNGPRLTYQELQIRFAARLREKLPAMSTEMSGRIVNEAMADWLLRCPLYFDEEANGTS